MVDCIQRAFLTQMLQWRARQDVEVVDVRRQETDHDRHCKCFNHPDYLSDSLSKEPNSERFNLFLCDVFVMCHRCSISVTFE